MSPLTATKKNPKKKKSKKATVAVFQHRPLGDNADERLRKIDHASGLLRSAEFTVAMLKKHAKPRERASDKLGMAEKLALRCVDDDQLAAAYAQEYALQPRVWLALRIGKPENLPPMRPAHEFITDHGGDEALFGPINVGSDEAYYIATRSVSAYAPRTDGGAPDPVLQRFSVVVHVTMDYVAFHWDNFTPAEDAPDKLTQNLYCRYVPTIIREILDELGGEYSEPSLRHLALTELWNRYENDPLHSWAHERIRAEAKGVALTASGSGKGQAGVAEIDVKGIEALTRALAAEAIEELKGSPDRQRDVERRLLKALIHRWNPKSYQFLLQDAGASDDDAKFRAHIYFGRGVFTASSIAATGSQRRQMDQDSFAHLRTWLEHGGSRSALQFILEHLEH